MWTLLNSMFLEIINFDMKLEWRKFWSEEWFTLKLSGNYTVYTTSLGSQFIFKIRVLNGRGSSNIIQSHPELPQRILYLCSGVGTGPGPCPGKFQVPGTESRNSLFPGTVPQSWVPDSLVPQIWVPVPVPDPGFFLFGVPVPNPGFSNFASRSRSRIFRGIPLIPDVPFVPLFPELDLNWIKNLTPAYVWT